MQVTDDSANLQTDQNGKSHASGGNLVSVKPSTSKMTVNHKELTFDAYTINNNNYLKLRDIAYVVNSTGKQFEVLWDAENNIIHLNSGKEYLAVGSELAKVNSVSSKSAKLTTSTIIVDGEPLILTAYNIGGNNYFRLRDIAKAFNIGVTWDNATRTIGINTQIDYED